MVEIVIMIKSVFQQLLHNLRYQKLSQDIAYTLGSFIVLAISGIIINVVVTAFRDSSALGVFNLAYAVYIIASQFAVLGLHYSVLRYSAYYTESQEERGKILFTASICSLLLGMGTGLVIYMAVPVFEILFKSTKVANAIGYSALGLSLFPLNKVLQAYLNGLRHMKAFSIFQGLRYLTVMVLVSLIAVSSLPIEYSTICFFVAELITSLLIIFYIHKEKLVRDLVFTSEWMRRHFAFGMKGFFSGMFAEVNSRLDVLMVGFFLTERAVGIYSFAAMLVDGLYHVLVMIRVNFNPMLVSALRDKQWKTVQRLRVQTQKFVLPVVTFLSLTLVICFYLFTVWIMPDKGLQEGLPSLIILLTGLVSISFLVPFDNLMLVSGHPGYQTIQQLVIVGSNLLFSLVLIPNLGIEGAAAGTAIGYVAGISILVIFTRRLIGWRLLTNTYVGKN